MSKLSKTAAASMRGGPGEVKKDPFDTNEKKIRELRVQRQNKLAVVRYDFIDALLEDFDKVQLLLAQEIANVVTRDITIEHLAQSTSALLKRAEEAEALTRSLQAELDGVQKQLNGLRSTLSEAANTEDGSYRP